MIFKKYITFIFASMLAITACKKGGTSTPAPTPTPAPVVLPNADIYLVGFTNSTFGTNATYWKNGVVTILDSSSLNSAANAIALKGNDVYIVCNTNFDSYVSKATYWKNGVFYNLSNNTPFSQATAITVSGNDVYIAGIATDSNGYHVPTYWKNGVATMSPDNQLIHQLISDYLINAIAVNGTDVYMAGETLPYNGGYEATYWKNGVATLLNPGGVPDSFANGIAISGTDVYVVGNISGTATYWKNGVATTLAGGNERTSDARAIVIAGADVYISGVAKGSATYWKNNIAATVTDGTGFSAGGLANAIVVNGTNVYMASGEDDAIYMTYWFNGQPVQVAKGIGIVNGMVVVPR